MWRCKTLTVCLLMGMLSATTCAAQETNTFQFGGSVKSFPNAGFRIELYDPNRLDSFLVARGQTDDDGKFSTRFEVAESQSFIMFVDRTFYRLWATPGADLQISIADDKATCSGSLSAENQFLFESGLAEPTANQIPKKFDANKCRSSCDKREKAQLEQLGKARSGFETSERFYLYAKAHIIADSALEKNSSAMQAIAKKEIAKTDLPKDYYDFWDSFPVLDDSAALLCRRYQDALPSKFSAIAERELIKAGVTPADNPARWIKKQLEVQAKQLSAHPKTNELLFANKVMFMIQYLPLKDTAGAIQDFSIAFPESQYLSMVKDAFAKTQNIDLASIDKVCNFVDESGNSVSFADLKGKVIYLDFWGLWCKACMLHQPDVEELIKKLSDNKDVVVVSLNFYDEHEDWKSHHAKNKPAALYWKPATEADEAKAIELFLIDAFPRYMIFGKDSKLVSPSAPIPRHKSLEEMLRNL